MKKELITSYSPLSSYHASGNKEIASFGKELLSKGKVGAVVLAGGQGTRLGIEGPKGTLPFSLIKQKSLFQLLSEKTLACSKQVGYDLQIAFMTSEENHATTVQFFEKHAFFGLKESQVSFFTQSSLPLTYEDGTTVFNSLGKELTAADGNGSFFWNFTESSLKTTWENLGIEYVTVMVVDNPLIDPFDAEVIGVTAIHSADATIEGVEKIHPTENVGCIAEQNGKLTVIEYSEIDPAEKIACTPQGKLKYRVANTSYFCFSMPFIKKVSALSKNSFPLHQAKKKLSQCAQPVLKSEYFIFDMLAASKKTEVVLYPRNERFAPIKNKEGADSVQTAQEACLLRDAAVLEELSGKGLLQKGIPLELDMQFYYPTEALIKKCKESPTSLQDHGYVSEPHLFS